MLGVYADVLCNDNYIGSRTHTNTHTNTHTETQIHTHTQKHKHTHKHTQYSIVQGNVAQWGQQVGGAPWGIRSPPSKHTSLSGIVVLCMLQWSIQFASHFHSTFLVAACGIPSTPAPVKGSLMGKSHQPVIMEQRPVSSIRLHIEDFYVFTDENVVYCKTLPSPPSSKIVYFLTKTTLLVDPMPTPSPPPPPPNSRPHQAHCTGIVDPSHSRHSASYHS